MKWHVLRSMWHWGDIVEENVDVNWHTFIFVFENVTWHFGFEVERQMKFVKHTHWFEGRLSPSTTQSRPNLIPLMLFESTYMYKVPICEFGCTTINFVHKCTQLVSVIIIAVQVEFQVDLVDTKLWELSRKVIFDHQTGLRGLQYICAHMMHREIFITHTSHAP